MKLLNNKVAMVTGAGQGVGEGIARALAYAGAAVMIAARRANNGVPAASAIQQHGGTAAFVRCDVTNRAAVDTAVAATVDRFGGLDVMVHNAVSPPGPPAPIQDIADSLIEAQIATAVTATFHCAQASLRHLRERGGSLILLTSAAGIEGSANLPLYATVKGAQRGILKSLAREWGPFGVRVNAIAPVAQTRAMTDAFAANPTLQARLNARTPLGRMGDPETDIGQLRCFWRPTSLAI